MKEDRDYSPSTDEVAVIADRLATDVAHVCATRTRHLVAALSLVETLLALPTRAYHRLGHLRLDVRPHVLLTRLFNLVAALRDVVQFFTQPIIQSITLWDANIELSDI